MKLHSIYLYGPLYLKIVPRALESLEYIVQHQPHHWTFITVVIGNFKSVIRKSWLSNPDFSCFIIDLWLGRALSIDNWRVLYRVFGVVNWCQVQVSVANFFVLLRCRLNTNECTNDYRYVNIAKRWGQTFNKLQDKFIVAVQFSS